MLEPKQDFWIRLLLSLTAPLVQFADDRVYIFKWCVCEGMWTLVLVLTEVTAIPPHPSEAVLQAPLLEQSRASVAGASSSPKDLFFKINAMASLGDAPL